VIVTGPNSNEITVTTAEGCNIIFTVSGRTATLNSGQQPCSSTSGGDLVSTQWNSGDLDLTSSTQVSVDLNFTSTDETEDVVCTVVLTATMTD
jgi:hypothetical protein